MPKNFSLNNMQSQPTDPAAQEDLAKLIAEGKVVDVVDGKDAHERFRANVRNDPWGMVAASCAPAVTDIIGQIDLAINGISDIQTLEVETGEADADGKQIMRDIQVRVTDPARVESLAAAAERLIAVHDYAMRRSAKLRNLKPPVNGHAKKR